MSIAPGSGSGTGYSRISNGFPAPWNTAILAVSAMAVSFARDRARSVADRTGRGALVIGCGIGRIPMNRDDLRTLQAPIKQRYRDDPAAALVTLKAEGRLGDGVSCRVATARALVEAGLHPATGGTGTLACSGDMLLEALVACAGVTLRSVATSMELDVAGSVHAEGDLDFRGTLGVDREAPVGFTTIRLRFELTSDASEEDLAKLLERTERYCVVGQTLAGGVPVQFTYSTS